MKLMPSKTCIVTGSSRGIGRAIALRLAQDGYDVCVNDIPAQEVSCQDVVKEIQGMGRKACVAVADVTKLNEVEAMIQTSVRELGDLNTMCVLLVISMYTKLKKLFVHRIANAGIAQVKGMLDLTEEDFSRMFAVNVTGVQNCYSAAAKQMIKQGNCTKDAPGKLIAASSIVAFKAFALLGHYSATKWAVRGLNQAYAMEMAEHNITANTYAPGIVDTPMWGVIDAELGKKQGKKKGEVMEYYVKELTALGRTSTPEDVAKLVSFLAGQDSNFVTGQTQLVDGGIVFT
ncbi:hypothetical protein LTR37_002906 [Vermiconidia calcicola]|uniref:Uncharacterized protein n=1 Tax=Vermiconidia calcicola TaxID=1690605 RepID=A0ACC3NR72_9PEZI|nr:hypothetical protein LTR37_002906 [Vermiconidia calcicola]